VAVKGISPRWCGCEEGNAVGQHHLCKHLHLWVEALQELEGTDHLGVCKRRTKVFSQPQQKWESSRHTCHAWRWVSVQWTIGSSMI
jgi:hypothetical protein